MFVGSIIGWIVTGLFVGALARLLVPGKQSMGLILTIILGVVGALVGGFISSFFFGPNIAIDSNTGYAVETAWPGWIMAVLGGVLVLWIAMKMSDRKSTGTY